MDTRDQRGTTLLMHAAALGSPEAVRLLLESGADVNAKNDLEATALILGAGNAEKARMLVEKGADVNAHSKMGRTPLMIAAGCDGCSATVQLLLDKGADPNAKDRQAALAAGAATAGSGVTANPLADARGSDRSPEREGGVAPNSTTSDGRRPSAAASVPENSARRHAARGETALTAAARANNFDSVKLLLGKGAGADVADDQGFTPLSWAAGNCNLEAVKLFLSKGANVNTANTSGAQVKFGTPTQRT